MGSALQRSFGSRDRMAQIEDEVRDLNTDQFIKGDVNDSVALQRLARLIEYLVAQCPDGRTGDRDERRALVTSVHLRDWADTPIYKMRQNYPIYNRFFDDLVLAEPAYRSKHTPQGREKIKPPLPIRITNTLKQDTLSSLSFSRLGVPFDATNWFQNQARHGLDP